MSTKYSEYKYQSNVLEDLNKLIDIDEFEEFIIYNNIHIQDFFITQSFSGIKAHKKLFDEVFTNKFRLVKTLDLSKTYNKIFIFTLLEASERLSCFSLFESFYKMLQRSGAEISLKHRAVARYVMNIRKFNDYLEAYEEILNYLSEAYETEEDNLESVVAVFLQYYSKVIIDFGRFNIEGVKELRNKIISTRDQYYILNNYWLDQSLKIILDDFVKAYNEIQTLIDKALSRTISIPTYSPDSFLIETNTSYVSKLTESGKFFIDIREIAIKEWREWGTFDVYRSLGRGVNILTEESQLFSYVYSYGNLHQAKLLSAYESLCFDSEKVEIVDWGCGQGIASLVFLEKFINLDINKVILIEPSEVALKRASLHIHNYGSNIPIKTVCKDIDHLTIKDITTSPQVIKIHLFSNILDIDSFSLPKMQHLITTSQRNDNYFICVSPYVNDLRTARLNDFRMYFQNQYQSTFNQISEVTFRGTVADLYWNCNNNFNGKRCFDHNNRCGCDKKWSRVERIFNVNIS